MKKTAFLVMIGLLLMAAHAYAANGDMQVDGKVGLGTTADQNYWLNVTGSGVTSTNSKSAINVGVSAGNAIIFDGGDSRITVHDGYGQFSIKAGADNNDNYTVAGDGASKIILQHSGVDGSIQLKTAPQSQQAGAPVTWNIGINLNGSGNVGIGTTPSDTYRLKIFGDALAAGGVWTDSDSRFKKNIAPVNAALDKVLKMQGVSYEWKTEEFKDRNYTDGRTYGVLAQDLEKVLPEAVRTELDQNTGLEEKAVAYTQLVPILIEAIKAQQAQIVDLQSKINMLMNR